MSFPTLKYCKNTFFTRLLFIINKYDKPPRIPINNLKMIGKSILISITPKFLLKYFAI